MKKRYRRKYKNHHKFLFGIESMSLIKSSRNGYKQRKKHHASI